MGDHQLRTLESDGTVSEWPVYPEGDFTSLLWPLFNGHPTEESMDAMFYGGVKNGQRLNVKVDGRPVIIPVLREPVPFVDDMSEAQFEQVTYWPHRFRYPSTQGWLVCTVYVHGDPPPAARVAWDHTDAEPDELLVAADYWEERGDDKLAEALRALNGHATA